MSSSQLPDGSAGSIVPNGSGAAALLSAGIGSFALAVISIAADQMPGVHRAMIFYTPTGPLSGVTSSAIVLWLMVWGLLHLRWRHRNLRIRPLSAVAMLLLFIAFLLTFPPIADLF